MKSQIDLINFIIAKKILQFGNFITNSGRNTPYFCNFGTISDPGQLAFLGEFYANKIIESYGSKVDNIFGPSYKGISLAIIVASILSKKLSKNVSFTFNRKELKDHGEKGLFIGYEYKGKENVVVVEDVITSGKSLKHAYSLLEPTQCNILGSIICVDRQEKTNNHENAKEALEQFSHIPIHSLVNIKEVFELLLQKNSQQQKNFLNDTILGNIKTYQKIHLTES